MRKLINLAIALCMALTLCAQRNSDVAAFGKIEKTDLELKECEFDKKADAVVLFDVGELYCDINTLGINMQLEKHVRIKILKDKGRSHADIKLRYYTYRNSQQIKNLSALLYAGWPQKTTSYRYVSFWM